MTKPLVNKAVDTYSYRGNMLSDKLWKRSLAVVGHYIFGALIIWVILIGILCIFAFIGGFMGW